MISVSLSVTNVFPYENLNPYGGTILTISGIALPQSLSEGSVSEVTFSDGSTCEIVALAGTSIRCITSGFLTGTTSATATVVVNGVSVTYSTPLTVRTSASKISSITPNSVSPVLKTQVRIIVTDYSDPLVKEDLEVSLVSQGMTPKIVRMMNVLEVGVDGSNQFINVLFGGSESGVYDVKVRSRSYGRFDSTGISLTLIGKITDFNPKTGSVHGGTLITIDGFHFSKDPQDNPVKIGYTDCLVEETSAT